MPDGFGVIGFAAIVQFRNLPLAIAPPLPDGIGIADACGPIGIADAASYQFEGVDFAVRAVRKGNSPRDPVESRLGYLDLCHCFGDTPGAQTARVPSP